MIKQLISVILLCSGLSLFAVKKTIITQQDSIVRLDDINIIDVDSLVFPGYLWLKGVVANTSDTVIILREESMICSENSLMKVSWEELSSILKVRVYESNFFINNKLVFPKDVPVFFIECKKEED